MSVVRVALCQINTVVGDIAGNTQRVLDAAARADAVGADVAVFPEMTITGYPAEDLLLKPGFVAESRAALEKVAAQSQSMVVLVGFADGQGDDVWNSAAVCANGSIAGVYHKHHLPNYGVFDEKRYFNASNEPMRLYEIAGVPVGVTICEDAWIPDGPVTQYARGGAQLVLNINGSPFRSGKLAVREAVIAERISEGEVPVAYVNLVGGQDELVFDGGSFVMDASGSVVARAERFAEDLLVVDVETSAPSLTPIEQYPTVKVSSAPVAREPLAALAVPADPHPLGELWQAMVLGTRDYVHKNNFTDICLGLSGGVDSSLVAAIAADALGPDHVHGVLMPSRYSSDHSVSDAEELATNLGIGQRIIPIEAAHNAFLEILADSFAGQEPGLTEENLQSRIRGVTLMALANKFGWLVLTTGNKSETAVGYSTLYGDTAGAFAVIKDVWKLTVYELCRWRNEEAGRELIPESVLTKAPSAELRPDQRDDQSLPPYEILDPILRAYVEQDRTVAEIVAMGLAPSDVVKRMCRLVDIAEFKRRQSPLGVRLTEKAFGRDRRMPMVNGFRG